MANDEEEYHQKLIFWVTTAVFILAITSYVLRLYTRYISSARFWYDDYVMGAALVGHFLFFLRERERARKSLYSDFGEKHAKVFMDLSFVHRFLVFVIMLVGTDHINCSRSL